MRTMVALIAVAATLLPVSAPAAAAKSRHPFHVSMLVIELGTAQSGTSTLVGIIKGTPLGPGTLRADVQPGTSEHRYAIEFFSELGTLKGAGTFVAAPQPDGTTTFTGTARLTHGTGRFKNATSTRLKLAGTQTSGDTPVQLELTGALSY